MDNTKKTFNKPVQSSPVQDAAKTATGSKLGGNAIIVTIALAALAIAALAMLQVQYNALGLLAGIVVANPLTVLTIVLRSCYCSWNYDLHMS